MKRKKEEHESESKVRNFSCFQTPFFYQEKRDVLDFNFGSG